MALKIQRVKDEEPYYKKIKKTDSTLCCQIKPAIRCRFCKQSLCKDCGRAWSGRKHFLLDLCRGRFSPEQIVESNTCFKKRIKMYGGKIPRGLGDCFICTARGAMMDTDRELIERKK